ncbi:carbamoyl phosphate synthase small subunit [Fructilactobacillus lindneri]|uniref:Carbamoyl phosphate synthase small chain n=2 Tax=Fructilactobacillus lindneri TaxID=53444 RepID=A0A0R2JP43_9LACO|nr:carbamoyl phosphate synthase small subunit [Fructilactobacillus lindneri]ANZ58080.1 carbamoyl phosphate synthase small subunit [Fructilactobacillus lindneri]ANZ59401.1 carbamoyl phosphate synthase small subunit [Fructilactobacillus lindneri]KRN78898.1 carbamoyl-phosphate synthase small subunit [Fructilactobacillus lindneri DSM 20690 = JCM 11027]POG98815.1 carbamoyl phosphate synthase small subunit [Fructilactobacillus lindneri]POH03088.1 carbamoyl phosphate synthase small subunit [Fructilac
MKKRYLLLEDGKIYTGEAFGGDQECIGELVFNTGMSGYQQSITDQSYNNEILMFTYPLIGNYGINRDNLESTKPTCKGVVVSEVARRTANWRMTMSLPEYLAQQNIPGISGIDTRAITKHIREHGAMKAAILNEIKSDSLETLNKTKLDPEVIKESATNNAYTAPSVGNRVVVIDFGLKYSILRELSKRNCDVVVLPPTTTLQDVKEVDPDGVMLTNGPGDPMNISDSTLKMIREVEQEYPIFGICMGHQLFALANGATTTKMKFGHRGFNHPVRNLETGRIDFTSQNHGYTVNRDSVASTRLEVSMEEINDHTVEGLKYPGKPAFSVQFHPDAAPGPHDADYLFDDFMKLMNENKTKHSRKVIE